MNSKKYTIDKQGSLGLLALGDVGLKAWRKVRGKLEPLKTKIEKTEKTGIKNKNPRTQ